MKKLYYLIVLALILGLVLTGCTFLSNIGQTPATEQSGIAYLTRATEDVPDEITLFAGQDIPVGTVEVWDDTVELTVKYNVPAPWCITETHLHVSIDLQDIPVNKKGNPIPGHFEKNDEHDCVHEVTYTYILEDKGWVLCEDLYIAAHAVVVKQLTDGGCAAYVHESSQGTERDGSSIQTDRSEPANALGSIDNSFFSLGFVDETSGGNIVLEFENYVGTSLNVVEQSPGTIWRGTGYPLEQAEVWVSANLVDWTYLGMANNQIAGGPNPGQSHENVFDLEECIKFVKIVDQTEPTPQLGDTADAFDIDAVCGGPCYQEESAWAYGDRFVEPNDPEDSEVHGGGNWATYFKYKTNTLGCPDIIFSSTNIEFLSSLPSNVQVNVIEDDVCFTMFKEWEGFLPFDLQYDLEPGRSAKTDDPNSEDMFIEEGTPVCIFYIQLDNDGTTSTLKKVGWITFGEDILGAIISGGDIGTFTNKDLMFAADDLLKSFTLITYPTKDRPDYLRGFDVNYGKNEDDALITGATIDFTMWVVNAHDSMRIIVPMVPVPCE